MAKTPAVEMSYKLNLDYVNAHYCQLKSHAVAKSLYHINEILKSFMCVVFKTQMQHSLTAVSSC